LCLRTADAQSAARQPRRKNVKLKENSHSTEKGEPILKIGSPFVLHKVL
jgi:hypothetical protein